MKHHNSSRRHRLNLILMILGMTALGSVLMILSLTVKPASVYASEAETPAADASDPPAPSHEGTGLPASERRPVDPKLAAAQNLSGLLLLFSLVAFAVAGAFLIWLIVSIRRSRPAWQTQQRYPRRRRSL